MIYRACMRHGLPLDDYLACPVEGHTCESWDIVSDGQVIGRANLDKGTLFLGLGEKPGEDLDTGPPPMPDHKCRRKGHWAWRFKATRGLRGGWICGTCADNSAREYQAGWRRRQGLPIRGARGPYKAKVGDTMGAS